MLSKLKNGVSHIQRYTRLDPEPPSSAEARFIRENRRFWSNVPHAGPGPDAREGYVLMELPKNAFMRHYTAFFSTVAARALALTPLGMVMPSDGLTRGTAAVLRSYGPTDFFHLSAAGYIRAVVQTRLLARQTYRTLRTPQDVLQLRVDGMEIGDLIYDPILRSGYATLDAVDERVLRTLETFYLHRHLILSALRQHPIRYAVFSHHIGVRAGVFFRYLLRAGVPVLLVRAIGETNLKEYRGLHRMREYPLRPEPQYIERMRGGAADEIVRLSDAYLDQRMGQQTNDKDAALAFDTNKRTFTGRADFGERFDLPQDRPNVFVMLHAFNDHPHMFGTDAILHGDYYGWFMETLRIARSEPRLNWIFKEHPSAAYYHTRDLDLSKTFAEIREPHIRFLGREADFNARSLQHVADAVVTCIGTAGLEFAALGKPAILAGRGPYSGFGFTHEPQGRAEYEALLRSIHTLPAPDEEQRRMARLILYFQLCAGRNNPFPFAPDYPYEQVVDLDTERFYGDAAALLADLPDRTSREMEKYVTFVRDKQTTQFVDPDLHPQLHRPTTRRRPPRPPQPPA